ncbi:hypothetical protein RB2654_15335 [Rhodobacterales bacterium HTCC2654]|uniref:Uncharacterized protein n=1 Tax=Maritimibacter alkaliphilus HTCC2654 TaxID=314271 RepID=A3VHB6_9RHOB|nr:hypothetical protein RB2654_15335 [Rhodobacterales bacterium HTCC2654] [Maritimibacter alkaliphilus HTCC2654]
MGLVDRQFARTGRGGGDELLPSIRVGLSGPRVGLFRLRTIR